MASRMDVSNRAKVVLVGVGTMGQIRSATIYSNPRLELSGIVAVDYPAAKQLAAKYSTEAFCNFDQVVQRFRLKELNMRSDTASDGNDSPRSVASSDASIDSSYEQGLDGLIVSVPTPAHAYYVKQAAKYGLAVFVEKPVALLPGEIEELYRECKDHNVPLCCGFQRRFDDSYVAAAKALKAGAIGRPLSSQIFFGDSPCPRLDFLMQGGNIFYDLCIHDVDFIRWALQDEVESVFAVATCRDAKLKAHGIHDNASVVLTFNGGTLVTINLSRWSCYGYDQRCDIFGFEGRIAVCNERSNSTVLFDRTGEHHSRLRDSFAQRFKDAYANEMDAFCDTILNETPWSISEGDVVAVQKIAMAAKLSCESGEMVRLNDVCKISSGEGKKGLCSTAQQ